MTVEGVASHDPSRRNPPPLQCEDFVQLVSVVGPCITLRAIVVEHAPRRVAVVIPCGEATLPRSTTDSRAHGLVARALQRRRDGLSHEYGAGPRSSLASGSLPGSGSPPSPHAPSAITTTKAMRSMRRRRASGVHAELRVRACARACRVYELFTLATPPVIASGPVALSAPRCGANVPRTCRPTENPSSASS